MSSSHPSPHTLPPITSLPWPVRTTSSSAVAATAASPPTRPTATIMNNTGIRATAAGPPLPISPPTPPSPASATLGPTDHPHPVIHRSHGLLLMSSSEVILAEKRRRNAGASSRFRERRKQRERELQERVVFLEKKVHLLESALRQYDPGHSQLDGSLGMQDNRSSSSSSSSTGHSNNLSDRVSQLEGLMTRFRHEKETDAEKLSALETENRYLKSLLDRPAQN